MKHARSDYDRIQDPAGLIPGSEPVFLLRGQDVAAPETVRTWARLHTAHGGDPRMAHMANEHAAKMEIWQKTRKPKVADLPPETAKHPRASAGFVVPESPYVMSTCVRFDPSGALVVEGLVPDHVRFRPAESLAGAEIRVVRERPVMGGLVIEKRDVPVYDALPEIASLPKDAATKPVTLRRREDLAVIEHHAKAIAEGSGDAKTHALCILAKLDYMRAPVPEAAPGVDKRMSVAWDQPVKGKGPILEGHTPDAHIGYRVKSARVEDGKLIIEAIEPTHVSLTGEPRFEAMLGPNETHGAIWDKTALRHVPLEDVALFLNGKVRIEALMRGPKIPKMQRRDHPLVEQFESAILERRGVEQAREALINELSRVLPGDAT